GRFLPEITRREIFNPVREALLFEHNLALGCVGGTECAPGIVALGGVQNDHGLSYLDTEPTVTSLNADAPTRERVAPRQVRSAIFLLDVRTGHPPARPSRTRKDASASPRQPRRRRPRRADRGRACAGRAARTRVSARTRTALARLADRRTNASGPR